jgi:small-conductance mechanosensitive channel
MPNPFIEDIARIIFSQDLLNSILYILFCISLAIFLRLVVASSIDRVSILLGGFFRLVSTVIYLVAAPLPILSSLPENWQIYAVLTLYTALLILLYNPLRELFAGDILRMWGAFKPGDYMDLDGRLVRVVKINSFNTLLMTSDLKKVFLPNTYFLNIKNVNFSKSGAGVVSVTVRVNTRNISIQDAKLVMLKTGTDLAKSEMAAGRAAEVRVVGVDGDNVELQLIIHISNPPKAESLAPLILERIYMKLSDVAQKAYL